MPSRVGRALAAGGIVALCLAPAAWAPDGVANVGVSVSFDRNRVARGQVAVAEIALANRGPDRAAGLVVEARVEGGRPLRAHAVPGWCAKPRGQTVRCAFRILGFGSGPVATLHVTAGDGKRPLRVDATIAARMTRDAGSDNDHASAAVRVVGRGPVSSWAEISFVVATPTTVRVGEPFTAVLTLLNRGPAAAVVRRISVTPQPDARVSLSALPRRLRVGEERTVRARITAVATGPLTIRVRVGTNGHAVAVVDVRAA